MTIYSSYDVRIPTREFNKTLTDTTKKYREAVAFFISVRLQDNALFTE